MMSNVGIISNQLSLTLVPERAKRYFEANRNVLIVEDDKTMSLMIEDILDDAGFEVKIASNWKGAFDRLQHDPIDFILLDLLLPDVDGFEIYQKLQSDADTQEIPVMIVTAWADESNLVRADQLGIKHVLPKPFTEDELLFSILTLLVDSSRQN
jgi:DNA-binding response OmpR family regulator